MATRAHVVLNTSALGFGDSLLDIQWSGLLNGDDGEYVALPQHTDYTVHAFGTPGVGFSLQIEGSNELTPANPVILNDTRGAGGTNRLLFTTLPILVQGLEAVFKIRPRITAGDGTTSVTVLLCAKRKAVV